MAGLVNGLTRLHNIASANMAETRLWHYHFAIFSSMSIMGCHLWKSHGKWAELWPNLTFVLVQPTAGRALLWLPWKLREAPEKKTVKKGDIVHTRGWGVLPSTLFCPNLPAVPKTLGNGLCGGKAKVYQSVWRGGNIMHSLIIIREVLILTLSIFIAL